eukprot:gene8163-11048_t
MIDERVSIAPMMEWTDPHYRMLMRGITKRTVLYTEMVVDESILCAPEESKLLHFSVGSNIEEEPSVVQLGGWDPDSLALASERVVQYGGSYGEINLNCGCPSPRVSLRCFGAKLMLEPELVREIVSKMSRRVNIPITVKCRIGADDLDKYDDLIKFITCASMGGAKKFIIHSRKCFLNGLTTKQNRDIPPLKYEVVHKLCKDFPELTFILNGGIQSLDDIRRHTSSTGYLFDNEILPPVHGAMIGRAAYSNPLLFATVDSEFYGVRDPCLNRREIIHRYLDYCDFVQSDEGPQRCVKGKHQVVSSSILISAMRNLINGVRNVNKYRTALNDIYIEKLRELKGDSNPSCREVIEGALTVISEEDLDAPLGNLDIEYTQGKSCSTIFSSLT